MNLSEAQNYVGREVRNTLIDGVQSCHSDPTDHRIYLMSGGERVIEVSQLLPENVTKLGTVRNLMGRPSAWTKAITA